MAHQEQILFMSNLQLKTLQQDAIGLLKQLIAIPSFSKEEDVTATCIDNFLKNDVLDKIMSKKYNLLGEKCEELEESKQISKKIVNNFIQ